MRVAVMVYEGVVMVYEGVVMVYESGSNGV